MSGFNVTSFVDHFVSFLSCVCHTFASVHCCLVATFWERADLLALVYDIKLCLCHFLMWYPGSGMEFDLPILDLCPFITLIKAQNYSCQFYIVVVICSNNFCRLNRKLF